MFECLLEWGIIWEFHSLIRSRKLGIVIFRNICQSKFQIPVLVVKNVKHNFCLLITYYSAINPILYNAMSDKFRKAFRTFLVCCDGKRRNPMAFGDEPLLVKFFFINQKKKSFQMEAFEKKITHSVNLEFKFGWFFSLILLSFHIGQIQLKKSTLWDIFI